MKPTFLRFRTIYHLLFAIVIVTTLLVQFIYGLLVEKTSTLLYVGLFMSYFTIISNILVAVVLCAEAYADLARKELTQNFERIRALATFCIITTGVTYTFFLRGPGAQGMVQDAIPWINNVFHHIMPIAMSVDWVLFPTKKQTHWHSILFWILFTLIYLIYVELLGLVTHAYPYFFVDPTKLHGYFGVLRASLGFVPFFLVFGVVIVGSNNLRLRFTHWKI